MSVDSGVIRDRLLAEIRRRRPEFEAAGNRAEELRTLPAETEENYERAGRHLLASAAARRQPPQ